MAYKEINEAWLVGAHPLGAIALEALMQKVGVPPEEVEDVYIGCDREGEAK